MRLAEPATARQIMRPALPEGATQILAGTAVTFRPDGLFDADPTQAFALVRWPDGDAAVAHVEAGSPGTWPAATTEAWHAALAPYRVRGEVNWTDGPLFSPGERPAGDGPVLTMTTTGFSDDPAKALALGVAMHEVQADDGAVPGRLRTAVSLGRKRDDGRTFTLWASEAAALEWAHRRSPHREMLRRQRDEELMPRASFTRFSVLAANGAWDGADPLVGPAR